ncbi:putative phospholipase C-like protein [Gregarina niphandrodes]|uniref:Phospholipase C-like protein n=1 Tax=Gregarina niphandrodes TaxID=110365 RepID=A0A023B3G8_GRENI|nr:putative phospholipase C-like protein [Gregarina niphandrodes]EZG55493.1 putative phospholipase C-like protein [Gregarina niphandrodes]|eukprot:XP_011131537.1 putative phospholipase C-like protein [Gregarina niphandrodes]
MSERVKSDIREVDLSDAVEHIQKGEHLLKYTQRKLVHPHPRFFHVDTELGVIRWKSPRKCSSISQLSLLDVYRIIPGKDSDFWKHRGGGLYGIDIVGLPRNLQIECPNLESWRCWFAGLVYAHQYALASMHHIQITTGYVRHHWELLDLDQDNLCSINMRFDILIIFTTKNS